MSDSITERTPPIIAEMDIENMSVRELQKAVKDRDRALQEKTDLQMALDCEKDKNTQLTKQQRMNNNLTAAYNKVAANKIAFLYENLEKAFKELAYEMTKFASIDSDVHTAYKKIVGFISIFIQQKVINEDATSIHTIYHRKIRTYLEKEQLQNLHLELSVNDGGLGLRKAVKESFSDLDVIVKARIGRSMQGGSIVNPSLDHNCVFMAYNCQNSFPLCWGQTPGEPNGRPSPFL